MWRSFMPVIEYILKSLSYKRRIEKKMDAVLRRVIRLEILDAIKRDDELTVFSLFDEYSALGGNSYISLMVEKYKKKKERSKK